MPVYEMQFKPSYLFGLNELAGLAYVQNLGLLMKRAPDICYLHIYTPKQSMLTQSQSLTPIFGFFLILAIKYSYHWSFCMLIMEE